MQPHRWTSVSGVIVSECHDPGEHDLARSTLLPPCSTRTGTLEHVPASLTCVLVAGPSMVPTLRSGDVVLVRRGARVRAGDVVLARFPGGPDRLVVKRAVRPYGSGWWVAGDNPAGSDDSRQYGAAEVVGRVVWRYWPPIRGWRGRGWPGRGWRGRGWRVFSRRRPRPGRFRRRR
jgi:nickel-type superoxide dismutase maturation protease